MIVHFLIILGLRNVTGKNCRQNKNIHFMLRIFFPKIVPIEIMWKYLVELDRLQCIIRCRKVARIIRNSSIFNKYFFLEHGRNYETRAPQC